MHSRRMTRPTVLSVFILAVFGMTITISSLSLSLSVSVSIVEGLQQPRSTHHQQRRRNNVPINSSSRSNVPTVFSQQQNQQRQQIVGETTSSSSASTTRIMTLSATGVGGSGEVGGGKGEIEKRVLDTEAIVKYVAAITIQMVLFKGFFTGIDVLLSTFDIQQTQIPFAVNFIFFFVFSLKSRIFNPLSNERPQRDTKEIKDKTNNNTEEEGVSSSSSLPARKMPEWTPPGITFPIVWILLIAPLRAASSALLVSSGNIDYASTTILTLMFHLSIGDTWNTINNVERRYGTSCVGVLCVWLSAAFAAYSYGQVEDPALAGKLLSLPLIWLTIASSLIIRTWQLNPNPDTGQKESLLPTKPASQEGSITKLVWFEKEEEE